MKKHRIFIDLIGTLFQGERLYYIDQTLQNGYYRNLKPFYNVLNGVKCFIDNYSSEFDVYIKADYLKDDSQEVEQMNYLLDYYLPNVKASNRIFVKYDEKINDCILDGIQKNDILIDDSPFKLTEWNGKSILLSNGDNSELEWNGERIESSLDSILFSYQLKYNISNMLLT